MSADGDVDFSKCTRDQLEEGLRNIDADCFPINFANLQLALAAKPREAAATILSESVSLPLVSDRDDIHSCLRFFVFHYMFRYFGWRLAASLVGIALLALQTGVASTLFVPCLIAGIGILAILPIRYLWSAVLIARIPILSTGNFVRVSQAGIDFGSVPGRRMIPWTGFSGIVEAPCGYLLVTANHGSFIPFRKEEFPTDLMKRLQSTLPDKHLYA